MANKANERIKISLKKHRVPVWMLADKYGKSENTMLRLFRHELPTDEQDRIISMIEDIAKERDNAN